VIVYCREHSRSIGVVKLSPGGFPSFQTRSLRWRDRHAAAVGRPGDHDNSFTNLREWTRPEVRVWCRDCGGERWVKVAALLAAFDDGRSKISL
jgi:hypothetical protein